MRDLHGFAARLATAPARAVNSERTVSRTRPPSARPGSPSTGRLPPRRAHDDVARPGPAQHERGDGTALRGRSWTRRGQGPAPPGRLPGWPRSRPAGSLPADSTSPSVSTPRRSTPALFGQAVRGSNAGAAPRGPRDRAVFDNTPDDSPAAPRPERDRALARAPDATLSTATAADNCAAGATVDRTVPAGNVFPGRRS